MATEPTPGPWTVVDGIDAGNIGRRVIGDGRVVAECSALDEATNEANARLIASADPCRERAIARLCEEADLIINVTRAGLRPLVDGLEAAVAAVRGPREERRDV